MRSGHCHLREGMRLFRLDRVLEAEMLGRLLRVRRVSIPPGAVLSSGQYARRPVVGRGAAGDQFGGVARTATISGALPGASRRRDALRCSTWSLEWPARGAAGLDCSFVVQRPSTGTRSNSVPRRSPPLQPYGRRDIVGESGKLWGRGKFAGGLASLGKTRIASGSASRTRRRNR